MEKVVVKWRAYSPQRAIDDHAHAETQITLIVSGGVEEKVGDQWRTIGPLEFVIKPAGICHANRFADCETHTVQFSVNPDLAKRFGIADRLRKYHAKYCPTVTQRFLRMYSGSQRSSETQASGRLLGEILHGVNAEVTPEWSGPRWLSLLAEQIENEYDRGLTLQGLARKYQRHPVSVARAFRARYGQSIKQRVCQLRVQQAANQLSESYLSATAISQACGFSDQSHMNRVFKSVTGMAPVQFRRLVHKKSC